MGSLELRECHVRLLLWQHYMSRHADQLEPMAGKKTSAIEQRVVTRGAEAHANALIKVSSATDLSWAAKAVKQLGVIANLVDRLDA